MQFMICAMNLLVLEKETLFHAMNLLCRENRIFCNEFATFGGKLFVYNEFAVFGEKHISYNEFAVFLENHIFHNELAGSLG